MIFYDHIKQMNFATTKLLQLWTYFDHQNFWFELLTRNSRNSKNLNWLHDLVWQKIKFKKVMKKLLIYFLIESHQNTKSYLMHSIVHDWCTKSISRDKVDLTKLALMMIELAVSKQSKSKYWIMQQRLLSHANRCVQQYHNAKQYDKTNDEKFNDAFHNLNRFYKDQNKLIKTKKMYQRALNEKKKAWNSNYTSTFDIVNNLSLFYVDQNKLIETKKMYQRALNEKKKHEIRITHRHSTSSTIWVFFTSIRTNWSKRKKCISKHWMKKKSMRFESHINISHRQQLEFFLRRSEQADRNEENVLANTEWIRKSMKL